MSFCSGATEIGMPCKHRPPGIKHMRVSMQVIFMVPSPVFGRLW